MRSAAVRALASTIGAIALAACSGSEDPAAKGAAIMQQARAAAGGDAWNQIRIWYERGESVTESGEIREYEHWGDLHTLSVRNNHPGQANFMVYDGHAAYLCADADCVSRTALDPQGVRIGGYLTSYGYFFPDRFAASFRYQDTREEGGVQYDIVEVSPQGMSPIEIWVDQSSHRISRLVFENGRMRTDLSDYRQVGSIWVPFVARDSGLTIKTTVVRLDPEDAGKIEFTPPGSD
jgi:hypothetical protein